MSHVLERSGGLLGFFRRWMHGSRELADDFIASGIEDWAAEGHISDEEMRQLEAALDTPEVAAVTANLGAHFAMSIPLRFPLGSLARFGWTLGARARAQWRRLRGDPDARARTTIHTVPVMLLALVPGFGAGAYLLAKPLRENRALPVIIFDRLLRKLPLRLYPRWHFVELMTWWARPGIEGTHRGVRFRERVATLRPFWAVITALLVLNALVLAITSYFFLAQDADWALSEFGVLNSFDAAQLLLAGALGMLAFRLFWLGPNERATHGERAGIFLWGAIGPGLIVFGFDDFFGVHERLGGWIARNADVIPLATNNADDIMTLIYGVIGLIILAVFRHELFTIRASAVLLVVGVLASAMMLGTDAFGHGPIKPLERPSQVTAVGILLLSMGVRYIEVRSALPRRVEQSVAPATAG